MKLGPGMSHPLSFQPTLARTILILIFISIYVITKLDESVTCSNMLKQKYI